jgi:RHS repeat-associated protein
MIKNLLCFFFLITFCSNLYSQYVSTPVNADTRSLNTNYEPGTIPGQASTSAGGAFVYGLPIELTPGKNNLTPSLAVQYNSNGNNSILGWGFSINTLSAISRGSTSKLQEGYIEGGDFSSTDRFYLNGERLVCVSGSYGQSGAVYQTQMESFTRISQTGSGTSTSFTVWTPGGLVMEYGTASDTRYNVSGGTLLWLLKKVKDYDGNEILYIYTKDTDGIRLNKISYAGNEVQFVYETRTDKNTRYIHGNSINENTILRSIKVYGQGSLAWTYQFNYTYDLVSKLNEVIRTAADGKRYNSTIISWNTIGDLSIPSFSMSIAKRINYEFGDFNGDGRQDYFYWPEDYRPEVDKLTLCITNAGGCYRSTDIRIPDGMVSAGAADIDGDGIDEICTFSFWDFPMRDFMAYKYYGFDGNSLSIKSQRSFTSPVTLFHVKGDFDGDEDDDFLFREENGSFQRAAGITVNQYPPISGSEKLEAVDMNGNGKEELCVFQNGVLKVYEYKSTNKKFELLFTANVPNGANIEYKDLNGDGNLDFLIKDKKLLYYNTGKSLVQGNFPQLSSLSNSSWIQELNAGDFNGDGMYDILEIVIQNQYVSGKRNITFKGYMHYSTGKSFVKKDISSRLTPLNGLVSNTEYSNYNILVKDMNGDGADDICVRMKDPYGGGNYKIVMSDKNNPAPVVTSVTNGMNLTTEASYAFLNDNSVYNQTSGSDNSLVSRLPKTRQVVSSLSLKQSGAVLDKLNYRYSNSFWHKWFGFVGFDMVTSTNTTLDTKTEQKTGFIGTYALPSVLWNKSYAGSSLVTTSSLVKTEHKLSHSGGFTLALRTDKTSQTNHLTSVLSTTSFSNFDAYFNPQTVTTQQGSALTQTKDIIYNNLVNNTHWLLGRPELITTTNKHKDDGSQVVKKYNSYSGHRLGYTTDFYSSPKALTTTYNYYTDGLLKSTAISGNGVSNRSTSYVWDATGRFVIQATNAMGHTTSSLYDGVTGKLKSVTDANTRKTTYAYNSAGTYHKITLADNTTSTLSTNFTSELSGALYKSVAESTGKPVNTTYYDVLGRVILAKTLNNKGEEIKVTTQYNTKGQVEQVSLPYQSGMNGVTSYAYDKYGRLTSKTLPNGAGAVSYLYNGLSTKITTPQGWTETVSDQAGFVQKSSTQAGNVDYTYFSNGQVKTANAAGVSISYQYNEQGRCTQTNDPNRGVYNSAYNSLGELNQSTDPRGNTYTYFYDALGRITTRSLASGGETTTWEYDPIGNKGALNRVLLNGQEHEKYTYNNLGQVSQSQQTIRNGGTSKSLAFAYDYDTQGRLSALTYPGGYKLSYTYNSYGFLSVVSDNKGKFSWFNPNYNDLGQNLSYSLGNGIVESFTYDALYRPHTIVAKKGSAKLSSWDFDFNTKSNLIKRSDLVNGSQSETFGYDGNNRLTTSSRGPSLGYNSNHGIATKSDVGTYNYNHMTKKHAVSAISNPAAGFSPPSHAVDYTAFNKIKTLTSTINGQDMRAAFTYGPNRQRSMMKVNKNGNLDYVRYYSGKMYEEKVDASGKTSQSHYIYIQNKAIGVFVDYSDKTDQMYYIHSDYLGSITSLSDQNGQMVQKYAYDAWGQRRTATNWSQSDTSTDQLISRGFTGHEHMTEFGLINMNGRVYDPSLGMFLSPDPLLQQPGNPLNYNSYSYVWNNPLRYTDPSGYAGRDEMETMSNNAERFADYAALAAIGGGGSRRFKGNRMGWNLGTAYGANGFLRSGATFEDLNTNINGIWISNNNITSYNGSAAGVAYSLYRSAHAYGRNLAATMAEIRVSASFDNGSMFTIAAGNGMYHISNLDVSVVGEASSYNGFELGPIGLGVSIEMGFPKWLVGDTKAYGFDVGLVADNTLLGIGVYVTKKTPIGNPLCFSVAPELFYVQSNISSQAKIDWLNGTGIEFTGSGGPMGASIGWDSPEAYKVYTASGFGRGIDFGYGTWRTNTTIYQLRDLFK